MAEKDIYKYSIVFTIFSKKGNIRDSSKVHYVYTSEDVLKQTANELNNKIADFKECYDNIYTMGWNGFTSEETLFGNPVIVHYDIYRQPFKIKEKDFYYGQVQLIYEKCNGTIKEYSENLSADHFIEYCLDKGIGKGWLNR